MSSPVDSPAFFPLTVATRREVAKDIVEFTLCDGSGAALPAFTPGAHLRVVTPLGAERKYSLTNAPADSREHARYVIAVKREGNGRGGSVSMADGLREGAELMVTAPDNAFPMATDAKRFLVIAGGIGITPITGWCARCEAMKKRSNKTRYRSSSITSRAMPPARRIATKLPR